MEDDEHRLPPVHDESAVHENMSGDGHKGKDGSSYTGIPDFLF